MSERTSTKLWVPIHSDFLTNPKTTRTARRLRMEVKDFGWALVGLWFWCMEYALDGDLSDFEGEDIADAFGWQGDAEELVTTLTKMGWLDTVDGRLVVHDWMSYGGKLFVHREKSRASTQRHREKRASDSDVTVTSSSRESHPYSKSYSKSNSTEEGLTDGDTRLRSYHSEVVQENPVEADCAASGRDDHAPAGRCGPAPDTSSEPSVVSSTPSKDGGSVTTPTVDSTTTNVTPFRTALGEDDGWCHPGTLAVDRLNQWGIL